MTPSEPVPEGLLLTGELVQRAKNGDHDALGLLMARYLPRLERWASGRLPDHARSLLDTGDLVQETLMRALERLDQFEVRSPGGFQAYVRQAVLNRIRDQVRRSRRWPVTEEPELTEDRGPSPLDLAIESDLLERYERAMATLNEEERRFIHLRIELDLSYEDVAAIMGRSSSDAARMAVQRALRKLGEAMGTKT